jgi:1-acyl-sn-glycerol-3-phosphate acyltransferase
MEDFFGRRIERIFKLAEQDAENLALVVFPKFLLEIVRKYFRVEVEGLEHIPKRGRALIAPNHSGCMGFDAVVLGHVLHEELQRIPRILTLWTFFKVFPMFQGVAHKLGLKSASTENGVALLKKHHLTVCFPEGEGGSFKPSSQAYRLQKFHTGFVRMALLTGAPIVPCLIVGAEETTINLGTLRLARYLKPVVLPIPLNALTPLPSKWKIRFLPAIDLSSYKKEDAMDRAKMEALAETIRGQIQTAIDSEVRKRPYVYIRGRRPRPPEVAPI